jgi:hypothetical protein
MRFERLIDNEMYTSHELSESGGVCVFRDIEPRDPHSCEETLARETGR